MLIELEVAYAKQDAQALLPIKAAPEITARQAIEISGILKLFPEIDLTVMDIGIFSKLITLDTILQSGDRVEIYRPLIADPKEQRQRRAKANKSASKTKSKKSTS
ncbi:hypothetical protein TI05_15355 [Achromatium sp. WMS3]|nr:hypothetical protein TI05_15355 [Achromatium sp. WMS3]